MPDGVHTCNPLHTYMNTYKSTHLHLHMGPVTLTVSCKDDNGSRQARAPWEESYLTLHLGVGALHVGKVGFIWEWAFCGLLGHHLRTLYKWALRGMDGHSAF